VNKELVKLLDKSKGQRSINRQKVTMLKKEPRKKIDEFFHEQHEEVFQEIDCLECANCCKTTSPIFKDSDIRRISSLFKQKEADFIATYLRIDEDGDYVLQESPCPFLLDDNKCFIYKERPQACREYPHTNRKNMRQILNLTLKNSEICPAVAKIFLNLKRL
jgi:Fe-S-cluster containining protein